MGVLRRLRGRRANIVARGTSVPRPDRGTADVLATGPPILSAPHDYSANSDVSVLAGRITLKVVGESHRQEALWALVGGRSSPPEHVHREVVALIHPDEDNEHDSNAISVWIEGSMVGYLSREDALRYRPGLLALMEQLKKRVGLSGAIIGGGQYEDGPGQLGVFLQHDPSDFGLKPPPVIRAGTLRTGLSDAAATDGEDESYDLGWRSDLPVDDIGAIKKLSQLLEHEEDPLDRHFMFCELEHALYRCRDVFTSALSQYDSVCNKHDQEMDRICAAFVTKWGSIPMLETYRQMSIRQAKATDFEKALWWAERGLELYGDRAARSDAVDDLTKRSASYRAKL